MIKIDKNILLNTTKDLTVLYAEDEVEAAEEVVDILNPFFKKIVHVKNGSAAKEYWGQNHVDIILTDINMPELNGIGLIKEIRKKDINVPIVVISAYNELTYLHQTISLGIDGYLIKPLAYDSFFTTMYKVVNKLRLEKENLLYKQELEQRVQEELEKIKAQEKIIAHQDKLASMGEMIDAIAHQWKQPITVIGMAIDLLEMNVNQTRKLDLDELESLNKPIQTLNEQKKHLLHTLDEFRNFFRPNYHEDEFYVVDALKSALLLVKDEFIKHQITFDISVDEKLALFGNKNDFMHLILNIINNAKDALEEKNIQNKMILISSKVENNKQYIYFEDNACGIPQDIIEKIFEANFSTKHEKGTGIGLYIASQIANKFNAKLSVKNTNNGAKFSFEVD